MSGCRTKILELGFHESTRVSDSARVWIFKGSSKQAFIIANVVRFDVRNSIFSMLTVVENVRRPEESNVEADIIVDRNSCLAPIARLCFTSTSSGLIDNNYVTNDLTLSLFTPIKTIVLMMYFTNIYEIVLITFELK